MLREFPFDEVAKVKRIDRRGDLRQVKLNHGPTRRRQHQNREASASQVLLVAQVLIGGDQGIEGGFCCAEKVAIFEGCPAHLVGGGNVVARQRVAQGRGRSQVKENLYCGGEGLLAPSLPDARPNL